MNPIARLLILMGLLLLGVGLLLLVSDKIPWLGRLPGDIVVKRERFTFYFPLVTCLILSVILSLIFWLFRR